MNILIKDNLVYKNSQFFVGCDFDLKNIDLTKKDIYVGNNGAGKSFLMKVFSAIAYLYSIKDHSPVHDYDTQKIIQNLIDVEIGVLSNKRLPSNDLLIEHFTSYQKSCNENESEEVDEGNSEYSDNPDVALALQMGAKLVKALDSYYYIKIGETAKNFFDVTNVLYYSNSQYPSNESFFFERASSFNSRNVDVPFWMLYRKLSELTNFEIKIWMNNSIGFANYDEIKKTIISVSFKEHIKYVFRHIFNFFGDRIFDNILENNMFKQIEEINAKAVKHKEKFPYIVLKLEKLSVEDYLILLMLKDCISGQNFGALNFEIYYKSTPFEKLNSGCRYTLNLECLKNVCTNGKRTLLIIDEPENSLHLTVQKEIAQKKDDLQIMLASHSPAFVMSLINEFPNNFILHIISRSEDKILNEEIILENYLKDFSLDETAAEFFSYSPFLDEWEKINHNIKTENLIDIDDFYEKIGKLE